MKKIFFYVRPVSKDQINVFIIPNNLTVELGIIRIKTYQPIKQLPLLKHLLKYMFGQRLYIWRIYE